ncbi:MAG: OmpA family protein [Myxococcota bacterium]
MRAGPTWIWAAMGPLLALPGIAAAQAGGGSTQNAIDVEHLHPSTSATGLISIPDAESQTWREWSVGFYVHYARNPLVLFQDRLQIGEVVGNRVSADLVGSLGLTRWLELGLAIPVTIIQFGDANLPTGPLHAVGMRDLRISAKFTPLSQKKTGLFSLAIIPELSVPTGDAEAFNGSGGVVFSPHLVLDRRFDVFYGIRGSILTGIRARPKTDVGNITVSNEIFYRIGAGVGLPAVSIAKLEGVAELAGTTALAAPFADRADTPLILSLALKAVFPYTSGTELMSILGVSLGLTRGYGAPDFQVFLGVAYREFLSDRDGDGILDGDDFCPDDPEDFDGFEDSDGCPEPDNDKDGIPDVSDKCPLDPEDKDGFEDFDGCPEPDNDKDGLPDTVDKCPNAPEDFDGFEDEDGCPDPDNDKDGVPDALDKCPGEKETINGVDDDDGCPDEGEEHVEVTSEKITIDTKIHFGFDSARIEPESFSILNQVALTVKANPELKLIRIEGHTDSRGADDYNLVLSQRRAEAVVAYLVSRGVEPERLEAVGYGEQKPLVAGESEEAWATNRRVEFTILKRE